MTSALRHDVRNAHLSMKHDVARQAANEMARKEVDFFFLTNAFLVVVVTVSDEENEIDNLARSGIWPGDFCAQRIFLKATCSDFRLDLERSDKRTEEYHSRSVLKTGQSRAKAHHLEQ